MSKMSQILLSSLLVILNFMYLLYPKISHINRRTQFENPVVEAKRRLEQQRQIQSQGLSALPLPTIYRGTCRGHRSKHMESHTVT